jgi:hypothetical protein
MEVDADGYNDGNRAFLQAFFARGQMTLKEGQKILAAIFSVQEGRPFSSRSAISDLLIYG